MANNTPRHIVAPSVLAADFGRLAAELDMLSSTEADWLHVDIMDGMFVPNISFGPDIMAVMKRHWQRPMDVHLMIEKPERYLRQFADAGADHISVHIEACPHLHRVLEQIRQLGLKAGVALNPHTSVSLIDDVLEMTDIVTLMSVNPGFGGQKFIYQTLEKITRLRGMITTRHTSTLISIDGGVGLQNAESILRAGADILIAGTSVFRAADPADAVRQLRELGGFEF